MNLTHISPSPNDQTLSGSWFMNQVYSSPSFNSQTPARPFRNNQPLIPFFTDLTRGYLSADNLLADNLTADNLSADNLSADNLTHDSPLVTN